MARPRTALGIELVEVDESSKRLLNTLAQLYQYDFSEFTGTDVGADGRYTSVDFKHLFAQPVHHAYLIRVDGRLAGFASAYRGEAFRNPAEEVWWMDEFFVMRKYRRRGVGERVATQIFSRLGGTWEVGQVAANVAAQAFWRRVIDLYTGGGYEEMLLHDDRWHGPVQYFRAPGEDR